jgi:formate hydrogenlyase subunit 6/NADH:ubiquinone oxidoreductase subunit I
MTMIKFFKSLLLIDILKTIVLAFIVIFTKKAITIKLPKQKVIRCQHTRRSFCLNQQKCISCKICEGVCPCGAITIISAKKHAFDNKRCAYCGLCQKACPKEAIEFTLEPV